MNMHVSTHLMVCASEERAKTVMHFPMGYNSVRGRV